VIRISNVHDLSAVSWLLVEEGLLVHAVEQLYCGRIRYFSEGLEFLPKDRASSQSFVAGYLPVAVGFAARRSYS